MKAVTSKLYENRLDGRVLEVLGFSPAVSYVISRRFVSEIIRIVLLLAVISIGFGCVVLLDTFHLLEWAGVAQNALKFMCFILMTIFLTTFVWSQGMSQITASEEKARKEFYVLWTVFSTKSSVDSAGRPVFSNYSRQRISDFSDRETLVEELRRHYYRRLYECMSDNVVTDRYEFLLRYEEMLRAEAVFPEMAFPSSYKHLDAL